MKASVIADGSISESVNSRRIPAVLATQRLISTQLYGLRPLDPVSICVSSALLIGAAIVAGYLPARQATKVDPMEALRYE